MESLGDLDISIFNITFLQSDWIVLNHRALVEPDILNILVQESKTQNGKAIESKIH